MSLYGEWNINFITLGLVGLSIKWSKMKQQQDKTSDRYYSILELMVLLHQSLKTVFRIANYK